MNARPIHVTLPICAAVLAAGAWLAYAGDLIPPAGPVAPTHKTLTEIEPRTAVNATNTPGDADSLFKISQAGSYYLMGNIQGIAAKRGIEIAASGVKVDLNGFDLFGVPGSLEGVGVTVIGTRNVAVVNGSVRNWGGDGVSLAAIGVTNCRIQDVLASGNAGAGISAGQGSTVTDCAAASNTGSGINANTGCTVADCSASFNGGTGISTSTAGAVSNCSAYHNTGNGFFAADGCKLAGCMANNNTATGLSMGSGCTVSNCSAYQNGGSGIITNGGSTVSNVSVFGNGGYGISTSDGCSVSNCSAYNNAITGIVTVAGCTLGGCSAYDNISSGIVVGTGCTVSNCSARQNGEDGISADTNCVVADCAAVENTRDGIFAYNGSTVSDCSAALNTLDGVSCGASCMIRDNNCTFNGNTGSGAGIHASAHSRIEGNNCASADRGIQVTGLGNFIFRNTCSLNTSDWELGPNNIFGPIVDHRQLPSASVSGFSASSSLGTTDANANFSN